MFVKTDALDKKYKPLIIKWLCKVFDVSDHVVSFKDQWIRWSINDSTLSIDLNDCEAIKRKIPAALFGTPQHGSLRIVNEQSIYIPLSAICHVDYPEVTGHTLIKKHKHKDGDGGFFYSYNWEVFLCDGTSIFYSNQKDQMDLVRRSYNYDWILQERAFLNFLESL